MERFFLSLRSVVVAENERGNSALTTTISCCLKALNKILMKIICDTTMPTCSSEWWSLPASRPQNSLNLVKIKAKIFILIIWLDLHHRHWDRSLGKRIVYQIFAQNPCGVPRRWGCFKLESFSPNFPLSPLKIHR